MTIEKLGWPSDAEAGREQLGGRLLQISRVRACRAFLSDNLGRLHGPTYSGYVYRPGQNDATCGRHGTQADDCRSGFDRCTHGFYVWHTLAQALDYVRSNDLGLVGVVDVSGKVDVGTDGARAEKLEIVAIAPKKRLAWSPSYRLFTSVITPLVILLWLLAVFAVPVPPIQVTGGIMLGIAVVLCVFCIVFDLATKGFKRIVSKRPCWDEEEEDKIRERLALIQRNYPRVKVYNSPKRMLRENPIDGKPAPDPTHISPLTTDDFWSINASFE